jgi:hypothetical protein
MTHTRDMIRFFRFALHFAMILQVSAAYASGIVFEGRIAKTSYDSQGNPRRHQADWLFKVTVDAGDFEIRVDGKEGQESYHLVSRGNETFSVLTSYGVTTLEARPGGFPITDSEIVEVLWLAFCSGKEIASGRTDFPFVALRGNSHQSNSIVSVQSRLGAQNDALPSLVKVYVTATKDRDGKSVMLPPPYEEGYLFLQYSIQASNTLGAMTWPSIFAMEHFVVKSPAASRDDVRMFMDYTFYVDQVTERGSAISLPPIPDDARVHDYRFRTDGLSIVDFPGKNGWVLKGSPRYAQLKSVGVSEESWHEAMKKADSQWKQRYRWLIIGGGILLIVLPAAVAVRRKKRKTKNQT